MGALLSSETDDVPEWPRVAIPDPQHHRLRTVLTTWRGVTAKLKHQRRQQLAVLLAWREAQTTRARNRAIAAELWFRKRVPSTERHDKAHQDEATTSGKASGRKRRNARKRNKDRQRQKRAGRKRRRRTKRYGSRPHGVRDAVGDAPMRKLDTEHNAPMRKLDTEEQAPMPQLDTKGAAQDEQAEGRKAAEPGPRRSSYRQAGLRRQRAVRAVFGCDLPATVRDLREVLGPDYARFARRGFSFLAASTSRDLRRSARYQREFLAAPRPARTRPRRGVARPGACAELFSTGQLADDSRHGACARLTASFGAASCQSTCACADAQFDSGTDRASTSPSRDTFASPAHDLKIVDCGSEHLGYTEACLPIAIAESLRDLIGLDSRLDEWLRCTVQNAAGRRVTLTYRKDHCSGTYRGPST